MKPTTIVMTALAIVSGGQCAGNLNNALGENKNDILEQVEQLQGTHLAKVTETIDILSNYDCVGSPNIIIDGLNLKEKGVI